LEYLKPLYTLSILVLLAGGTVHAQEQNTGDGILQALGAPAQPGAALPAAPATPAVVDLTQLRRAFDDAEAARQAAAPGSQERATAADNAAALAAKIGWTTFDAGKFEEAASWFDRRANLRQEAYETWKTALQAQLENTLKVINTRIEGAKTEAERAQWRGIMDGMQGLVLAQLQVKARESNNATDMLAFSRQKLALNRRLLESAKNGGTAAEISDKTLQIVSALDDIGGAQVELAQFDEAEKTYAQSYALRQSLPADTPGRNLFEYPRQLAIMRGVMGDLAGARQYYLQTLSMRDNEAESRQRGIALSHPDNRDMGVANDVMTEVMILNNLGQIARDLGDYKASQEYYDRSLKATDAIPQTGIAGIFRLQFRSIVQSNIAVIHADQGLVEQSRQEMEAVVQQQRQLGADENAATGLASLGGMIYDTGDLPLAQRYMEQALQIAAASQDLNKVVNFSLQLSVILTKAGQLPEAEKRAREAVVLARKSGDLSLVAEAARTIAQVRLAQNKPAEAEQVLQEADSADQKVGAPLSIAYTLDLHGQAAEAQGNLPVAIDKYKQSVQLLEGVRATAVSETAFSSLKSNYRVYERLVQALIKQGRAEEAFDYLNRSRSKQLQDALRVDSLKTGNKALQALLERAGTLDTRTRAMEAQLRTEQAKPAAQQDPVKIQNLKGAIATTRGEWRKAVEQIKAADPSYEKLFTVKPLVLSETQRSIPADAAFVMYVPLKSPGSDSEELYIFLVTKESLKIITPHVKADDLWKRIRAVRRQIAARQDAALTRAIKGSAMTSVIGRGGDTPPPTAPEAANEPPLSENLVALYDMLITPIEADVAQKKLLAFIPTQLLYYLPMQALAKRQGDDFHFLIEDKQLVYLTGADVMKVVQTPDAGKATQGLVAFGDPVGANLPNAEEEVKSIAQIFPASAAFEGAQVTKPAVTDEHNLGRRVLHFATHGRLDQVSPARSYILLSPGNAAGDEQLTVGEVWDLPLQKVDLVTLSACDTALGERDPNGTEITTMAEAFSSAGASSVLASLWSVADDSTKDLMVEFYSQLAAGKTKAEALQAAQLKVMKEPGYHHPYFWAPFVLMGDWR
jgi:tetratricopeptide (TPR) repeat protein